jgi:N-acylneuraminate cytidylyltransferase
MFDEIMVSTDDDQIAEIALQFGAKVPFLRSAANSDDFASTSDVLSEVITQYDQKLHRIFEFGCCIYPTAPLTTPGSIIEGFKEMMKGNFKSVFPVVRYSYPIERSLRLNEQKRIEMIWPENIVTRSQDLKPTFHDAGQWYWFNCDTFLKENKLFTDNSGSIELDEIEVQDIDTETDWLLAELKYKIKHSL